MTNRPAASICPAPFPGPHPESSLPRPCSRDPFTGPHRGGPRPEPPIPRPGPRPKRRPTRRHPSPGLLIGSTGHIARVIAQDTRAGWLRPVLGPSRRGRFQSHMLRPNQISTPVPTRPNRSVTGHGHGLWTNSFSTGSRAGSRWAAESFRRAAPSGVHNRCDNEKTDQTGRVRPGPDLTVPRPNGRKWNRMRDSPLSMPWQSCILGAYQAFPV